MVNFNIGDELNKVETIINAKISTCISDYNFLISECNNHSKCVRYLLYVLEMTTNHPELDTYLEELIQKYTLDELNKYSYGNPIWYCMVNDKNISLTSWKTLINYGVDMKMPNEYGDTVLHDIRYIHTKLSFDLANLLINSGVDLNICNNENRTVFDVVAIHMNRKLEKHGKDRHNIREETKSYIRLLIDSGAKINISHVTDLGLLEFIENYRSQSIKLAIKK